MAFAQTVLNGKAVEKKGGAPVPGAVVYTYSGETLAAYAVCDEDGSFSLSVPQGRVADKITVMCMGYKTESMELDGRKPPFIFEMTEEKLKEQSRSFLKSNSVSWMLLLRCSLVRNILMV